MNIIQLIKDFRKWRKEKKFSRQLSKCSICAYERDMMYNSYCCECMNGIGEDWFTPRLKPISADKFASIIIDYILGKDWQVTDPLSKGQILALTAEEILKKIKI